MKLLVCAAVFAALTGCASHRIEMSPTFQSDRLNSDPASTITSKKVNRYPGGEHCYEAMMHVLTIGLIPTHCVDTYQIQANDKELGTVKVISMSGWIPLFMALLPQWRSGMAPDDLIQALKELAAK